MFEYVCAGMCAPLPAELHSSVFWRLVECVFPGCAEAGRQRLVSLIRHTHTHTPGLSLTVKAAPQLLEVHLLSSAFPSCRTQNKSC